MNACMRKMLNFLSVPVRPEDVLDCFRQYTKISNKNLFDAENLNLQLIETMFL